VFQSSAVGWNVLGENAQLILGCCP